jgi:hypothetical protein
MCEISREEAAWRREHAGEKGGEERRIDRNSVGQFGTGNRKCRWRARVYPERGREVLLLLQPFVLWAPCKARWVWAVAVANYLFLPRAHCCSPMPAAKKTRQMASGNTLTLAAMYLRLELRIIQTKMAQKPKQHEVMYPRALRTSQNANRAKAWLGARRA